MLVRVMKDHARRFEPLKIETVELRRQSGNGCIPDDPSRMGMFVLRLIRRMSVMMRVRVILMPVALGFHRGEMRQGLKLGQLKPAARIDR